MHYPGHIKGPSEPNSFVMLREPIDRNHGLDNPEPIKVRPAVWKLIHYGEAWPLMAYHNPVGGRTAKPTGTFANF
jgi:hypothetical protein